MSNIEALQLGEELVISPLNEDIDVFTFHVNFQMIT